MIKDELADEKFELLLAVLVGEAVCWGVDCALDCQNSFIDVTNKLVGR